MRCRVLAFHHVCVARELILGLLSAFPWFNLDEGYEFLQGLALTSQEKGDKDSSPSLHASTLNSLIQAGKTKRATRTSTSFGSSRATPVSISVLGNGHPDKFIPMERGLIGLRFIALRER